MDSQEAPKILIIEDEPSISELIQSRLKHEGYSAYSATDGEDGFKQFLHLRPDLIILDINLPKISGYEVCRRIRREEEDDTPILMLTCKNDDADKIVGRVKGANTYMTKPFEAAELLKEIKTLLETRQKNTAVLNKNLTLNAIGIVSKNVKKSIKFYALLGIQLKETGGSDHYEGSAEGGLRIMVDSVELIQSLYPDRPTPKGSGIVLCFKQESPDAVDLLFTKIVNEGFKGIRKPWNAFWGQRYAAVLDPDGNQIDIFAAI